MLSGRGYIVSLSGVKDEDIRVVGQSTWDWIHSEHVGEGSSWPEVDPVSCKTVNVTCGSPDNDRAIQCEALKDGFHDVVSALTYLRSTGLRYAGTYKGCIY